MNIPLLCNSLMRTTYPSGVLHVYYSVLSCYVSVLLALGQLEILNSIIQSF